MNELQRNNFQYSAFQEAPAQPSMTAHDLALVLWRRLWLVVLIMVVSTMTAVVLSKRTPKAWRATAQLLLVQRAPMMVTSSQAMSSAPMVESVDTQITLLQSRALARLAAKKVGINADTLLGASTVAPQKEGDDVIDVAVEADSRRHAQDWANALCQTFVDYKKSVSQDSSRGTLKTLQIQAAQAKKQADAADAHLQGFERTHKLNGVDVLDAPAQKTAALNAVLAQDAVVAGLQNDYATAQAKNTGLEESLQSANRAIKNSQGVRDDDEAKKLQADLIALQRERVETAQRYRASFPGKLSGLDARIADTARRLHKAIQGTLDNNPSLQAQSALVDASRQARADAVAAKVKLGQAIRQRELLRQQTTDLPQIVQQADTLTRAVERAHKTSDQLDQAVQAAQLDQAAASGNVQIVQPAFAPEAPIRPSPKRDLLVGAGVGLCLSLLAIFLLEQTDRSVRTAADVRRLADGPVIAVLPQMTRAERGRLMKGETPPTVIEAYNAARANMGLAFRQRGGTELDDHQVILVSSALPGEGKSLTASELAQSYARAGRRVVLVNADMRRASSLPLLQPGKTPGPGLAEVLSGGASVRDALVETDLPNLSVLHGGKATRNPIDLISQPRMADTIHALRAAADVVVMDSPPAAVVADALILAPHVDCILYVVGVGMVNNENVRHTAAALASATPKMLAYFINRIPHVIGEQRSYSYADYMYADRPTTGAAVAPANGSGGYTATRTMVLQHDAHSDHSEQGSVVEVTAVMDVAKIRSAMQVLPEIGSRLTTLEGPYVGQNFALSPTKPLILGTLPDSDIVLVRDETISHVHARIAPVEGGYAVYDDSSTNGTFVNGALVSRHTLEVGDVLQLGASKFRYE